MYECLVGYTPFYADEPVMTCRKILRWQNFLEIPPQVIESISPACLEFMQSLLSDSSTRLGKRGMADISSHPWMQSVDFSKLHTVQAPYIPEGSRRMKSLLNELSTIDKSDPSYSTLVSQITANFDEFNDDGVPWGASRHITRKDKDNQFIGYTFKRKKVPSRERE